MNFLNKIKIFFYHDYEVNLHWEAVAANANKCNRRKSYAKEKSNMAEHIFLRWDKYI